MKTEILYGIHPVTEALKAARRQVVEVFVGNRSRSPGKQKEVQDLARSVKVPVNIVGSDRLGKLTGGAGHQGMAARVGPYPFAGISDLFDSGKKYSDPPLLLVLDGVLDPHNLGAIVRTALCAGMGGVIIPKDRSAHPTPAVSRASAGALEHARVVQVTNLVRTLRYLQNEGLWVMGLDRESGQPVYSVDLTGPVALVIGGEEKGIRRLVRTHCDRMIAVPQSGAFNSLNASVAGAVVIYEAVRQRIVSNPAKGTLTGE